MSSAPVKILVTSIQLLDLIQALGRGIQEKWMQDEETPIIEDFLGQCSTAQRNDNLELDVDRCTVAPLLKVLYMWKLGRTGVTLIRAKKMFTSISQQLDGKSQAVPDVQSSDQSSPRRERHNPLEIDTQDQELIYNEVKSDSGSESDDDEPTPASEEELTAETATDEEDLTAETASDDESTAEFTDGSGTDNDKSDDSDFEESEEDEAEDTTITVKKVRLVRSEPVVQAQEKKVGEKKKMKIVLVDDEKETKKKKKVKKMKIVLVDDDEEKKDDSGYLYIWHQKVTDRIKVGKTTKDLSHPDQHRKFFRSYSRGGGEGVKRIYKVKSVHRAEREILNILKPLLYCTTDPNECSRETLPIEHLDVVIGLCTLMQNVTFNSN